MSTQDNRPDEYTWLLMRDGREVTCDVRSLTVDNAQIAVCDMLDLINEIERAGVSKRAQKLIHAWRYSA